MVRMLKLGYPCGIEAKKERSSKRSGDRAEIHPELDPQAPSPPTATRPPTIISLSDRNDASAAESLPANTLPNPPLNHVSQSYQAPNRRGTLSSLVSSIARRRGKRGRSRNVRDDPLGLVVLHSPSDRAVDILFVHGLGGSSLRTWCRDRDLDYLWPRLWLPPEIPTARILSFGYNANFRSKKEKSSLTISDFATDLLFRMKHEEAGDVRLGQVPIIVVAHSMGGLVFKKAFIHGHIDPAYSSIVSSIKAVLFLATPHRGTDLAEVLHAVLASGYSTKEYVRELVRRSPRIDELNDIFRHHASKLHLFSFYETLATPIGPMSTMIVDKASSVMGYPSEISQPLVANHHNVCKFTGADDPNYTSVVGTLRSVANTLSQSATGCLTRGVEEDEDLRQIQAFLGVSGPPYDSYLAAHALRRTGTCTSFLSCPEMETWLSGESAHILWAHAPPGSGKSILCSFVIDSLLQQGRHCAYFFFKHDSRQARSVAHMIRSLAYQMALISPEFRRALTRVVQSGMQIDRADATTVWEALFSPAATARTEKDQPVFWVIDALDESESSKQVIDFASRAVSFGSPVRILMFSRHLASITQSFHLARKRIPVVDVPIPDNTRDIRLTVAGDIDYLLASDAVKAEIVEEITSRAQSNFLWASLVLKRVAQCHRQEQVRQVLDSTPNGMDKLYDRMFDVLSSLEATEDQSLAEILLLWAMYAEAPLSLDELSEAYPTQMSSILDPHHTICELSGQFVVINANNEVVLVHHSAREYLRKAKYQLFSLEPKIANEILFCRCIEALSDRRLRRELTKGEIPKFLRYAATSWAFHLQSCRADSDRTFNMLIKFFNSPFPLSWLQYLAMSGRLLESIRTSGILTQFTRERREANRENSSLTLIETWAADLVKITAKFGRHLHDDPLFIYKCIPPLSPQSSIIHQKFSANPAVTLSVCGRSSSGWDDCLARVSANPSRALRLAASSQYLAVISDRPKGTITLWDTNLFVESKSFSAGEHVWALSFNKSGSVLACYGISQTFVWEVDDGSLQMTVTNPSQERAIAFNFDANDTITMVSDLRGVYQLSTEVSHCEQASWSRKSSDLLEEPGLPEGTFLSTPSCVAFNSDCSQMAVAYRAFPLSIWNVDPPEMVARLKRTANQGEGPVNSYTGDNHVVWHPSNNLIIGIYGQVFKWSPVDGTYEEVKGETGVVPHGLQCSPNGLVFITSDVEGSIKIYDVSSMTLIYKLSSTDSISRICFSPDSLRFYDLRGCYCNIWEPNCLVKLADAAAEQRSDADSVVESFWLDTDDVRHTLHSPSICFVASESQADSKPAVCAVAAGTKSTEPIAYANETGAIEMYDPVCDRSYVIAQTIFGMNVEHMVWNGKHDRLAYSFGSGAIVVKSLVANLSSGQATPFQDFYVDIGASSKRGRTRQLIFNSTGNRLLVLGTEMCQVLAIPSGEVIAETDLLRNHLAAWTQHPTDSTLLVCTYADKVAVYSWMLEPQIIRFFRIADDKEEHPEIDRLLPSYCSKFLLLRTATTLLGRTSYNFLVLPTGSLRLGDSTSESADIITPFSLPDPTREVAQYPVGILADGRFVFLDKSLRVCTSSLQGDDKTVSRHFFLPHDWVTSSDIRLCRILRDGALLCSSNGEIAIMKSDPLTSQ